MEIRVVTKPESVRITNPRIMTLTTQTSEMRNIFRFTFEREAQWLVAICLILPLLAILLGIVLPGLWRRWFP